MPKLLVIDDEELISALLTAALSAVGHDVLVAADGKSGVALAMSNLPDRVITDMSMTGMTGWQVIEKLKSDPKTKHIPIIALTAHDDADDREAAYRVGCDAYESKPLDIPRLIKAVDKLLG